MNLTSVTLCNFQCFGPEPTEICLSDDITALIGANGTGKTAILTSLARIFGQTQRVRTIRRTDFHIPPTTAIDSVSQVRLYIEVLLTFPELARSRHRSRAVPPTFAHMMVKEEDGDPYCRVRLDATWTADGTTDGAVEQDVYWVSPNDDPKPVHHVRSNRRLTPQDRSLVQVNYIPATRDPAAEFKSTARSRAGRIMRAVLWDTATRQTVEHASDRITTALGKEQAVLLVDRLLSRRWNELRDGEAGSSNLRFAGWDFDEIVRHFDVSFEHPNFAKPSALSALSEGQQSLFYLALVAAIFDMEDQIAQQDSSAITDESEAAETRADNHTPHDSSRHAPFDTQKLDTPALTIFGIEEPENHLAPHYLSRIIALLRNLNETGRAQTIISSHSPAVLRRVMPHEIRHLRIRESDRTSTVRRVTLPEPTDQSSKYIREAVTAYPELYFAKFVILAEGPSEELAIPKMAIASGLQIDKSFVSVVPLGGRHVSHLWRLLTDLEIPHATLLDLDLGRTLGGWHRIKYVCQQLLAFGIDPSNLLRFQSGSDLYSISLQELDTLHSRELGSIRELKAWLEHLERFSVYFSAPLDFDFAMLRELPDAYKSSIDGPGPSIPPKNSPAYDDYLSNAIAMTVSNSDSVRDFYLKHVREAEQLIPWYRYLFLSRSKPDTHFRSLVDVPIELLREKLPPAIRNLLTTCRQELKI